MQNKRDPSAGEKRPLWRVALPLLVIAWLAGGMAWIWFKASAGRSAVDTQLAIYADYGGSASCRECHEEAFAAWKNSNHGQAERLPDPARDDAMFIPRRSFRHATQETTFLATNGIYELVTAGLGGSNEVFIGERVLGNYPLRQMLVPVGGGRWQTTEAAWDPRSNEWFNVYGTEDRKPGEWGHWLGRGMNWNSMCAVCHNTRLRKKYDPATDTYRTTMVEHGVGCESCHGPLKAHNAWQRANKGKGLTDPTLRKITREEMFAICGGCHSRRADITGDAAPGDSYWDHFFLTTVDESNTFYPDGQIWDEDYEFTALLGSRMYDHGVRCMECHDSHTLKNRLPGNYLCLTCHAPGMTNAPTINPVMHSHHQVFGYDSNGVLTATSLMDYQPSKVKETGGECVNCHMPQTPYMQRHLRHDHGFTIPDPLLTKKFGIPNACERCHADKGTDWNLTYVEQWYGTNMNRLYRHRASVMANAKQNNTTSTQELLDFLNSEKSYYWQAVGIKFLRRWIDNPKVTEAMLAQLGNTNALVREAVVAALGPLAELEQPEIVTALKSRLEDASRNVRISAARHLATDLDTNSPAGKEYIHFLEYIADQPLGQLQIGAFKFMRGDPTNALIHFQTAAKWDPYSPGIRHELAIGYSQLGRIKEAVTELEAAVKLAPKEAEFHYKLALALNEIDEIHRAISELEAAVQCDPQLAPAWYNLGLAKNLQGDKTGALEALSQAELHSPNDPRIPYAKATILAGIGRKAEARAAAQRALNINVNFPDAARLLKELNN